MLNPSYVLVSQDNEETSKITSLIIGGNSICQPVRLEEDRRLVSFSFKEHLVEKTFSSYDHSSFKLSIV